MEVFASEIHQQEARHLNDEKVLTEIDEDVSAISAWPSARSISSSQSLIAPSQMEDQESELEEGENSQASPLRGHTPKEFWSAPHVMLSYSVDAGNFKVPTFRDLCDLKRYLHHPEDEGTESTEVSEPSSSDGDLNGDIGS